MRLRVFVLGFFVVLTACETAVHQQGIVFSPHQLTRLTPGKTTKKDVQDILGTPQILSPFEDKTWYYLSRKTESFLFFQPQLIENEGYALSFSAQGVLEKVEKIDTRQTKEVLHSTRQTPSAGHTTPVGRQIFKNLGVAPSQPSKGIP